MPPQHPALRSRPAVSSAEDGRAVGRMPAGRPAGAVPEHRRLLGWQVRIFAVTWLAYAGLYLTRKALSIAKIELKKPEVMGLSTETLSLIDGGYLTAYACGQFVWGILDERLGTGTAESGILGSLFDLAGPLGIFAGGWVSDRLFRSRGFPVITTTLFTGGLALALLPLMPATRWSLGAMLFAIGMLVYIPDSLVSGAAAIDFGTRRGAGTAAGVINGVGSLGAIAGGTLPGFVKQLTGSDTTPWNGIFFTLAGGLILAGLCVAPQWNRLPPVPIQPAPPTRARRRPSPQS